MDLDAAILAQRDELENDLIGAGRAQGEVELVNWTSRKNLPQLSRLGTQETTPAGNRLEDFLQDDMGAVMVRFLRNMSGDTAYFRHFGDHAPLNSLEPKIREEFAAANEGLSGRKLTRQVKRQERLLKDARVMEHIIRGLRGAGEDHSAIPWRLSKAFIEYNAMRLGGLILPSSIPDSATIAMNFTLGKVFREEWRALVQGLKNIPNRARGRPVSRDQLEIEALYGSAMSEIALQARLEAVWDVARNDMPGNWLGRAWHRGGASIGKIAGFTYFTNHGKRIAGRLAAGEILVHVGRVLGEYPSNRWMLEHAERFLSRVGINGQIAEQMWREMTQTPGGGAKHGKMWLPNTEAWENAYAREAYHSAIAGVVENAPITPGVEVPNWASSGPAARAMTQYRKFGAGSSVKLTLFASQEFVNRPVNTGIAVLSHIALGALSFYLKALAVGGERLRRVEELTPQEWIVESILASGLLGMGNEALTAGLSVPIVQDWLNTEQTTRGAFGRPVGRTFGVTEGLVHTGNRLLTSLENPAQAVKYGVSMTPYQNLFMLARAFNGLEQFVIDEFDLDKNRKRNAFTSR